MKYLKFFNSKIYHLLADDGMHTLCSITDTSSEEFTAYAGTEYPLPQKTNTPPNDAKLCPKCQKMQSKTNV